jgi:lipopolysaccharide export system permease protein
MIIFRYIFREIYSYLLAITSVLLIIFITNQFERYLHNAALGNITMLAVMKVMMLQVPLLIAYLLPLGFYLAVLLAFGRMYIDNEMTV